MNLFSKANERIRKEWQELGFYYDYNDVNSSWQIIGSKDGILKFCQILDNYANDKKYQNISEDEHYGPYQYLKLLTWDHPFINDNAIWGKQSDFKKLSNLIKDKLKNLKTNDRFNIDKQFADNNKSTICFIVCDDKFDPASADPQLNKPNKK